MDDRFKHIGEADEAELSRSRAAAAEFCAQCCADKTSCGNCMLVVHHMSEKVRGTADARCKCGTAVSNASMAWVSDDWGRVTCPRCLKLKTGSRRDGGAL